jgi:hypothetical protein
MAGWGRGNTLAWAENHKKLKSDIRRDEIDVFQGKGN